MENEYIEETQETSTEDVKDETNEGQEETNEGQEETKDWKAEALKYKAIAERKEKKLQEQPKEAINKTNNAEQSGLTREEAIFFAKGGTEEDLAIAKKIANLEGTSILAAMEDEYYKTKVSERQAEARAKANQIGASHGSPSNAGHQQKPMGKMTREEHIEAVRKKIPDIMG